MDRQAIMNKRTTCEHFFWAETWCDMRGTIRPAEEGSFEVRPINPGSLMHLREARQALMSVLLNRVRRKECKKDVQALQGLEKIEEGLNLRFGTDENSLSDTTMADVEEMADTDEDDGDNEIFQFQDDPEVAIDSEEELGDCEEAETAGAGHNGRQESISLQVRQPERSKNSMRSKARGQAGPDLGNNSAHCDDLLADLIKLRQGVLEDDLSCDAKHQALELIKAFGLERGLKIDNEVNRV